LLLLFFNTVIGAPVIIQAKVINKTNVDLQWTPPNDFSDIVLSYRITFYGYQEENILGVCDSFTPLILMPFRFLLYFILGYQIC